MLFRHRRKSILFFLAVVTIAVVGVLLLPKKYRSEAQFFVKLNLKVDPIETDEGQLVMSDPERDGEMRSVVALFHNRHLLEQVVDKLGTETVFETDLKNGLIDNLLASVLALLPISVDDEKIQREKAIRQLSKTLKIDHPKKSHVVSVSYKSRSAERAKQVLDVYVEACDKQHLEVNKNSNSYEFFVKQEQRLRDQVVEAKGQLRDAKNRMGLVSLPSQRNVLEQHVLALDRSVLDTATELASVSNRIEALRKELPFELQSPSAGSALTAHAIDEMRNQLFTHELSYRDLLARYQKNHPKVIAAKDQIDEARMLLSQQQLGNELSRAESLRSKQKALLADYETTNDRLHKLNEAEVQIAELDRQAGELTVAHRLYQKKLEQSRLDQQLQEDQISNLRLAQAPTLMGKALSRKGALICGLALVVGLCGAVGLSYTCELLDQSLATPSDVEDNLGVPVLMSLPQARLRDLSYN